MDPRRAPPPQEHRASPRRSRARRRREWHRLAESLLEIYLGADAGRQVLSGRIRRGEGTTLAAAIWFCDLRDFTSLSNQLPRDEVIALLNDYFDAMARPVVADHAIAVPMGTTGR